MLLLAFSAFFSGAEAAFFSLAKSGPATAKESEQVMEILSRPRRLLITLLTGNTVVNTVMAFLAALIAADIAAKAGASVAAVVALETVLLTVVILLVSEITPKILALRHSEKYARRLSLPVRIISLVLYPLASLLYNFTHLVTKWLPLGKDELFESRADLRALADVGADRGNLNEDERAMIKSVLDYGETAVREIMVPRIDVVGIEKEAPVQKAVEIVRSTGLSKFPVFDKTIDDIEGVLYAKDLLPYLNGSGDDKNLLSFCRDPFFVPESKQIDDLLRDFQRRRETVAVVVDEFGGTAGLVTVEDIVEEVVGEIKDEFDREPPLVVPLGKNRWLVDAKIAINDLQDEVPVPFPEEREYDTLGGFILQQFGEIPSPGNRADFGTFEFEIRTVEGTRITQVVISKR